MIKKSFLTCLLLLPAQITPQDRLSQETIAESYQNNAHGFQYLEFKFVIEPSEKLQERIDKLKTTTFSSTAIAAILTSIKQNNANTDTNSVKPWISAAAIITIFSLIAKATFDYCSSTITQEIQQQTLINFIRDWDIHRYYIPTQLIPLFDELAMMYELSDKKTFTTQQVSELFSIINHLLEHEFSDRYKKEKPSKDGDVLKMVKGITDIAKNIN
jgi:hypothetical protein